MKNGLLIRIGISLILFAPASLFAGGVAPNPLPKDIVFGVDGMLLQGIPSSSAAHFDPATLVQVNGKYYRVADNTLAAIRRLSAEPGVRISFFSEFTQAETAQILDQISQKSGGMDLKTIAYKVLGQEDLSPTAKSADGQPSYDHEKDLKKINPDLSNVVLVDENPNAALEDQGSHVFNPVFPYYQFEKFDDARTAAKALEAKAPDQFEKRKQYFPATQKDWQTHQDRMALTFGLLENSLAKPGSFASAVQAESKLPQDDEIQTGLRWLSSQVAWKIEKGQIKDCVEQSVADSKYKRSVSKQRCLAELPVVYKWVGHPANTCGAHTKDGAFIEAEPVEKCISALGVHYLWTDKLLKNCGVFTKDYVFVKQASAADCDEPGLFCSVGDGILTKIVTDTAGKVLYEVVPNTLKAKDDALEGRAGETLRRKGSFATVLMDDSINGGLVSDLGSDCANFVKAIYKSGHVLDSPTLKKAAKPIENFKYLSGNHPPVFHHWTNASEFVNSMHPEIADRDQAEAKLVADGAFNSMFLFYRTRSVDQYKMWRRVHYLAEDTQSSRFEGNTDIVFYINPKAKIVSWDDQMWLSAMKELNDRYPGLDKACGIGLPIPVNDTFKADNFNELLFMIAEDSGIDLIDYQTGQWFQLVRPNSIEKTEIRH